MNLEFNSIVGRIFMMIQRGDGVRDIFVLKEAIDDEISSILENNTWMLLDLLQVLDYFVDNES